MIQLGTVVRCPSVQRPCCALIAQGCMAPCVQGGQGEPARSICPAQHPALARCLEAAGLGGLDKCHGEHAVSWSNQCASSTDHMALVSTRLVVLTIHETLAACIIRFSTLLPGLCYASLGFIPVNTPPLLLLGLHPAGHPNPHPSSAGWQT
jgi:hypothetical protein